MANVEQWPLSLVDLLTNSVVLRQVAPYITVRGLLALGATSKIIRNIINSQSDAWRYLDLADIVAAKIEASPLDVGGVLWRAERMDESLTEDDFYGGPLRGIFSRLHQKHILKHVQTLILDGLSVPTDIVWEIVTDDRFNVKILSIREAKNLNPHKLQQMLRYIVRPTRAEGTLKLKALYFFGAKDTTRTLVNQEQMMEGSPPSGVTLMEGAQIGAEWNQRSFSTLNTCLSDEEAKWYGATGRALRRPQSDWPETLQICNGLIAFDAVLCRGPRHDITKVDSKDFLQPAIATIALGPAGCEICRTCPERPAIFGQSPPTMFPLLGPPPSHSSTVRAAQIPHSHDENGNYPRLLLRCDECLKGRWCERCNRWWCEDCYQEPPTRNRQRTDLRQEELREDLIRDGWASLTHQGPPVKVYSKLCVENCLVSEMMSGAGSNGMWG
ncbi:hypothetical protein M433DRAFT_159045 [Acidomyces richmondensis BFW]|nr:hypothetical protein M433DRAFT_159045 [Acidomyces richmondensis BFW]